MQRGLGDLRNWSVHNGFLYVIQINKNPSTAQSRGVHLVVGVDVDDALIQAAWRRRRAVWSLQTPSRPLNVDGSTTSTDLKGASKSVKSSSKKRKRQDLEEETPGTVAIPRTYFPASCEHEFGSLPIPPSSNRGKTTFPHNISFRTADWTITSIPEDAEGYDVVIAYVPASLSPVYPPTKYHFQGFQSPNGYI
jgi:hypothetical protein